MRDVSEEIRKTEDLLGRLKIGGANAENIRAILECLLRDRLALLQDAKNLADIEERSAANTQEK